MIDFNKEKGPDDLKPDVQPDVPPLSDLTPDITPEMMQEIKESQEKNITEWEEQNAELAATLEKLNGPKEDEEEEGEGQ